MARFGLVGNFFWLQNVASLLFYCLFNKALLSSTKNKTHYFTLKLRMSDMNNQNNLKESLSLNIFESLTSNTYRPVSRGVHGVHLHPPTGPKGLHFDTQYPSYGVQSVKLKLQT